MKPAAASGFDMLGAELPTKPAPLSWSRTAIAVVAGAVAAAVVKKHPVLAGLGAAALASNIHAVAQGDRSLKDAAKRMGRHMVATVSSLSVPKYPAAAYAAGAVAGDLLFDGQGGGMLDEIMDYEGIRAPFRGDVIDAEFTEIPSNTKALVKK
jgi:hypothetical protein